jgi:hypothetical protein
VVAKKFIELRAAGKFQDQTIVGAQGRLDGQGFLDEVTHNVGRQNTPDQGKAQNQTQKSFPSVTHMIILLVLGSDRFVDHIGNNRVAGLFQCAGALAAHIQILTDQEALVANQPLADRAEIDMLRGIADRRLPG